MTNLSAEALNALQNHQQQLDACGTMVGVSRQALDELLAAHEALLAERERLLEALTDATESLNTLATLSGKDEHMKDMVDVRSYARSRHQVASAAIAAAGEG